MLRLVSEGPGYLADLALPAFMDHEGCYLPLENHHVPSMPVEASGLTSDSSDAGYLQTVISMAATARRPDENGPRASVLLAEPPPHSPSRSSDCERRGPPCDRAGSCNGGSTPGQVAASACNLALHVIDRESTPLRATEPVDVRSCELLSSSMAAAAAERVSASLLSMVDAGVAAAAAEAPSRRAVAATGTQTQGGAFTTETSQQTTGGAPRSDPLSAEASRAAAPPSSSDSDSGGDSVYRAAVRAGSLLPRPSRDAPLRRGAVVARASSDAAAQCSQQPEEPPAGGDATSLPRSPACGSDARPPWPDADTGTGITSPAAETVPAHQETSAATTGPCDGFLHSDGDDPDAAGSVLSEGAGCGGESVALGAPHGPSAEAWPPASADLAAATAPRPRWSAAAPAFVPRASACMIVAAARESAPAEDPEASSSASSSTAPCERSARSTACTSAAHSGRWSEGAAVAGVAPAAAALNVDAAEFVPAADFAATGTSEFYDAWPSSDSAPSSQGVDEADADACEWTHAEGAGWNVLACDFVPRRSVGAAERADSEAEVLGDDADASQGADAAESSQSSRDAAPICRPSWNPSAASFTPAAAAASLPAQLHGGGAACGEQLGAAFPADSPSAAERDEAAASLTWQGTTIEEGESNSPAHFGIAASSQSGADAVGDDGRDVLKAAAQSASADPASSGAAAREHAAWNLEAAEFVPQPRAARPPPEPLSTGSQPPGQVERDEQSAPDELDLSTGRRLAASAEPSSDGLELSDAPPPELPPHAPSASFTALDVGVREPQPWNPQAKDFEPAAAHVQTADVHLAHRTPCDAQTTDAFDFGDEARPSWNPDAHEFVPGAAAAPGAFEAWPRTWRADFAGRFLTRAASDDGAWTELASERPTLDAAPSDARSSAASLLADGAAAAGRQALVPPPDAAVAAASVDLRSGALHAANGPPPSDAGDSLFTERACPAGDAVVNRSAAVSAGVSLHSTAASSAPPPPDWDLSHSGHSVPQQPAACLSADAAEFVPSAAAARYFQELDGGMGGGEDELDGCVQHVRAAWADASPFVPADLGSAHGSGTVGAFEARNSGIGAFEAQNSGIGAFEARTSGVDAFAGRAESAGEHGDASALRQLLSDDEAWPQTVADQAAAGRADGCSGDGADGCDGARSTAASADGARVLPPFLRPDAPPFVPPSQFSPPTRQSSPPQSDAGHAAPETRSLGAVVDDAAAAATPELAAAEGVQQSSLPGAAETASGRSAGLARWHDDGDWLASGGGQSDGDVAASTPWQDGREALWGLALDATDTHASADLGQQRTVGDPASSHAARTSTAHLHLRPDAPAFVPSAASQADQIYPEMTPPQDLSSASHSEAREGSAVDCSTRTAVESSAGSDVGPVAAVCAADVGDGDCCPSASQPGEGSASGASGHGCPPPTTAHTLRPDAPAFQPSIAVGDDASRGETLSAAASQHSSGGGLVEDTQPCAIQEEIVHADGSVAQAALEAAVEPALPAADVADVPAAALLPTHPTSAAADDGAAESSAWSAAGSADDMSSTGEPGRERSTSSVGAVDSDAVLTPPCSEGGGGGRSSGSAQTDGDGGLYGDTRGAGFEADEAAGDENDGASGANCGALSEGDGGDRSSGSAQIDGDGGLGGDTSGSGFEADRAACESDGAVGANCGGNCGVLSGGGAADGDDALLWALLAPIAETSAGTSDGFAWPCGLENESSTSPARTAGLGASSYALAACGEAVGASAGDAGAAAGLQTESDAALLRTLLAPLAGDEEDAAGFCLPRPGEIDPSATSIGGDGTAEELLGSQAPLFSDDQSRDAAARASCHPAVQRESASLDPGAGFAMPPSPALGQRPPPAAPQLRWLVLNWCHDGAATAPDSTTDFSEPGFSMPQQARDSGASGPSHGSAPGRGCGSAASSTSSAPYLAAARKACASAASIVQRTPTSGAARPPSGARREPKRRAAAESTRAQLAGRSGVGADGADRGADETMLFFPCASVEETRAMMSAGDDEARAAAFEAQATRQSILAKHFPSVLERDDRYIVVMEAGGLERGDVAVAAVEGRPDAVTVRVHRDTHGRLLRTLAPLGLHLNAPAPPARTFHLTVTLPGPVDARRSLICREHAGCFLFELFRPLE